MQSIASFSLLKVKRAYLTYVSNLINETDQMLFQFDTGSSITLIGLNSVCGINTVRQEYLKKIIQKEILTQHIKAYGDLLRTVTGEHIEVYPCKSHNVSVAGTRSIEFYFHIYLGNVNIPLLGFDFIDDCSFHHSIDGEIETVSIANEPGKRFYSDSVLDFDKIMRIYRS